MKTKTFQFDTFENFNEWHKKFIQTNVIIEATVVGGKYESITYTAKVENVDKVINYYKLVNRSKLENTMNVLCKNVTPEFIENNFNQFIKCTKDIHNLNSYFRNQLSEEIPYEESVRKIIFESIEYDNDEEIWEIFQQYKDLV